MKKWRILGKKLFFTIFRVVSLKKLVKSYFRDSKNWNGKINFLTKKLEKRRRPFDLLWEKTICYSMREDHLLFCERRSFVLLWEKTICPSTLLWEYEVLLYEKTKCKSLLSSFEFVGKLDLSTRGLFWSKSNLRANQFEEGRLPPCVLSSVNRRVIMIQIKFTGKSIRKKK